MAATQPASTPSTCMPSPVSSDSSHETRSGEAGSHGRSSRPGRSPVRPLLRTAFRGLTSVVVVVVGEKGSKSRPRTEYLVHKDLLTSASPFFAAALDSKFAQGPDLRVHLPEEKPDVFEWFLQWLYTGALTTQPTWPESPDPRRRSTLPRSPALLPGQGPQPPTPPSDAQLDGDLRNPQGSPKYFLLLDLYALSDRLLTTPLNNHILSTIARLSETTNSVPTPSDTWILYDAEVIRETAPARRLVLDLFAYKKTDKLLETHKDDWHPRFLRDLVVRLKRPGPDALERHCLVAWSPRTLGESSACEGCRELLRPVAGNGGGGGGAGAVGRAHGTSSGDRCCQCFKAFCNECLRRHAIGSNGFSWPHDPAGCKPWAGRGMCLRYHEHADGESCA